MASTKVVHLSRSGRGDPRLVVEKRHGLLDWVHKMEDAGGGTHLRSFSRILTSPFGSAGCTWAQEIQTHPQTIRGRPQAMDCVRCSSKG